MHKNSFIKKLYINQTYVDNFNNELSDVLENIWKNKNNISKEDLILLGNFSKKSYIDVFKLIENDKT